MAWIPGKATNFRASPYRVEDVLDVIKQVKLWHDGVRFRAAASPPTKEEMEAAAWDKLISEAPDPHHRGPQSCDCLKCKPRSNRRYK